MITRFLAAGDGVSLVLDQHREFLSDRTRLDAFQAALNETIASDHAVLDLGSGTGILGLLACRAGARRVYSVDEGGILQIARQVGRANGFDDRITYLKGLSTHVVLPERVDVIVADQIGHFGFEAGIVPFFDDARHRLLKPGGITIPSSIELRVAPIEAPALWDRVTFWNSRVCGFDVTAGSAVALNSGLPVRLEPQQLLGEEAAIGVIDLTSPASPRVGGDIVVSVTRDGVLHGIGGWFLARLSKNVQITNSPVAKRAINRQNVYFPIGQPVDVRRGDRIRIVMNVMAASAVVTWRVEVAAADGSMKGAFSHSTWRGALLCAEDLERTRPDYLATLSRWGEARRSVLELCNGATPLAHIERALQERHPDLFPSAAEAGRFVGEVLSQDAQ